MSHRSRLLAYFLLATVVVFLHPSPIIFLVSVVLANIRICLEAKATIVNQVAMIPACLDSAKVSFLHRYILILRVSVPNKDVSQAASLSS